MIKFDILNRYSGAVQFTAQIDCAESAPRSIKVGLAVSWAVRNRVDLREADLYKADLQWADLRGADLHGADLREANLRGADIREADLSEADLSEADLRGADLHGADLREANLRNADLRNTDLRNTNLRDADLRGANLCWTNGIADRIIDGGIRSDGYRFMLTRTEPGPWRVKAGCRNFTLDEAHDHWSKTRPEGDPLGDETRLIIAHMVAVAKVRKWPEGGEE